jgi:RING-type zinc-finger
MPSDYDMVLDMECPICFEEYSNQSACSDTGPTIPKILPCSHVMCARCIKRVISTSTDVINIQQPLTQLPSTTTKGFHCPICLKAISIHNEKDVDSFLPTHRTILEAAEEQNVRPKRSASTTSDDKRKCHSVRCCGFDHCIDRGNDSEDGEDNDDHHTSSARQQRMAWCSIFSVTCLFLVWILVIL